jgi:hypothetical protein
MRDYFAEFLLNPRGPISSKLGNTETASPKTVIPLKYKIACALGALGIGVISWKASKWHAGYQFLQKQTS